MSDVKIIRLSIQGNATLFIVIIIIISKMLHIKYIIAKMMKDIEENVSQL
jgi:hypothetical protein